MLDIFYTSRFKKDFKIVKKRGKDISKLQEVISHLVNQEPLPLKYKDHPLIGNYAGRKECHIEPDWLLIYKVEEGTLRLDETSILDGTLILERTGSHSDLFS